LIAVVVGAVIVWFLFPKREQELQLLAAYHAEDTARTIDLTDPAEPTGEGASGQVTPLTPPPVQADR
jgi:hypothetical protein